MLEFYEAWRTTSRQALILPSVIKQSIPLPPSAQSVIIQSRQHVADIMTGNDDRLLVVVGPCSIHDTVAALDYAQKLQRAIKTYTQQLCIVMRIYFEKPRTTTGWKGLINDPYLDQSHAINHGFSLARRLLSDIATLGVPAATEFTDTFSPLYIGDFITWGAIGARSSEARLYRELASGLPMVVGFKNNTDGNIQIAIDAVETAAHAHHFFSIDELGRAVIIESRGNPYAHIILRGSSHRINYDKKSIEDATSLLKMKKLQPYLMIDCSHGNSAKTHIKQQEAAQNIATQIAAGNRSITGVMLESFLLEGRQEFLDKALLQYGQSITDACLSWEQTLATLDILAESVEQRRVS